MERETGIEPATNSLEGCDSTTELLPPLYSRPPARTALLADKPFASSFGSPTEARPHGLRGKVGGEGRTRTFEARRRQIYSLLRLTASLPRQLSVCVESAYFDAYLEDRDTQVDGAGEGI